MLLQTPLFTPIDRILLLLIWIQNPIHIKRNYFQESTLHSVMN